MCAFTSTPWWAKIRSEKRTFCQSIAAHYYHMILLDFTFVSFLINIIPIKLVPTIHLDMEKSRESVLTSVVKSDI
jgi:hypothetical protein